MRSKRTHCVARTRVNAFTTPSVQTAGTQAARGAGRRHSFLFSGDGTKTLLFGWRYNYLAK